MLFSLGAIRQDGSLCLLPGHGPTIRRTTGIFPTKQAECFCGLLAELRFEPLEHRSLLSVVPPVPADFRQHPDYLLHPLSPLSTPATFDSSGSSSPNGLTPNQIRGAYGLGTYTSDVLSNGISFGGTNGDGSGETIAIIDSYDDPNALADLNAFRRSSACRRWSPRAAGAGRRFRSSPRADSPSPRIRIARIMCP